MRPWIVCLILFGIIGLVGCSNSKPANFSGKSASWSVDCSVRPSSNEQSYVIKYTGKDTQPVNIRYSFEDSKNFKQHGESDTRLKNLKISGSSTLDKPYADEDGFNLRIQWNDSEETIHVAKK